MVEEEAAPSDAWVGIALARDEVSDTGRAIEEEAVMAVVTSEGKVGRVLVLAMEVEARDGVGAKLAWLELRDRRVRWGISALEGACLIKISPSLFAGDCPIKKCPSLLADAVAI